MHRIHAGRPLGRPLRNRSQAMKKERGPQATKNTRPMAGTVGASRAFSVRQVMTVRNGKTAAETDRSRGEARQRDFITAHSSIMAGFYEPRTTNNGLSLGFRCGVPPRQIHEMNAVRRWPVAVRKKKKRPRLGHFLRDEGHSRRCIQFEFVAAQRHLSPKRPANCGLRPAGPPGPNINVSLNIWDLVQK